MDRIEVSETRWRAMDAWTVRGDAVELVVTRIGAHIAAIRVPGEALNPLWQPPWPAATPDQGGAHPEVYGGGPEASLLAGIVGHNLCLDRFGPPRPGEYRPVHGEAGIARWTIRSSDHAHLAIEAHLVEARLRISRDFTFRGREATVMTTVTHDNPEPRDIEWAEHVTIGDPFLDGAELSAEADGAWLLDDEAEETRRFSGTGVEREVPVDGALAMPAADSERAVGDIVTTRLRRGWFRAARSDLNRALEYEWNADEFPWLCLWTQHRSRTAKPWNGVTRARGMEFSTKPFPEGEPPESRATSYQGRPTTCSVPPGAGLTRSFVVRWGAM